MTIRLATIEQEDDLTEKNAYDAVFWLSYFANTSLIVCISVLFRYADFVAYLGGDEKDLGFITGCGMVGALLSRIGQGPLIDRLGARSVWLVSLLMLIISLFAHLTIAHLSPMVYLFRLTYMIGLAGAFGASITYISMQAPAGRTAEMVGVLGSSGFIGLGLGPILGDAIFGQTEETTQLQINTMFVTAIVAACGSLLLAIAATWSDKPTVKETHPPPWKLVRQYRQSWILLMSFVMGVGVLLPQVFLSSYALEKNLKGIQIFFLVYAFTAFTVRLCTAKFTDKYGVKNITCLGISLLILSIISYLIVSNQWLLALPAFFGGLAHAFLFPAIIGGGSSAFPRKYRGTGTTLMLAALDFGGLVSQPVIGYIIRTARNNNYLPYETMFVCLAVFFISMLIIFAVFGNDDKCETGISLAREMKGQNKRSEKGNEQDS